MLGLFTYFYVVRALAVATPGSTWASTWTRSPSDIAKRPFILVGFTAFVLMTPLAATSFNRAIKALGARRWQTLHRLVYVIALLGLLHFFWMRAGKNDFAEVFVYAAIVARAAGLARLERLARRGAAAPAHARPALSAASAFSRRLAATGPRPSRAGGSAWPRSPLDQHFGGAAAGVVVAGHAHAVGAGRQHRQQVAGLHIASARSRPIQSPLSHTGPTTS